jgi:hypothetical protein
MVCGMPPARKEIWSILDFLMVGSQILNLIPGSSFDHNLCFRCPNGSCKPILDIYVSITFQWYIKLFNPLGFDPCNCFLNIQESTGTPTPKVGVPLGVWGSIPSHFLALLRTCGMTPKLPSWPSTLQPLALVASPRLRLRHLSIFSTPKQHHHKLMSKPTIQKSIWSHSMNLRCP